MWSAFREPTEEEQEREQALLDEFYDPFIQVVAEGRKLPPDDVRAIATGEMFTAVRGKEMNLVDELGDLDSAIDMAAEMGKTPRKVRYVRPKRDPALAADVADGDGVRRRGEHQAGTVASTAHRLSQTRLVLRIVTIPQHFSNHYTAII